MEPKEAPSTITSTPSSIFCDLFSFIILRLRPPYFLSFSISEYHLQRTHGFVDNEELELCADNPGWVHSQQYLLSSGMGLGPLEHRLHQDRA